MNSKFKIKEITLLSVMALSALSLTGCFGESKSEIKVVELIVSDDKLEGAPMATLVDEYNQSHKNVQIRVLEYPYKEALTKVRTMISSGNPPAMMRATGIESFQGVLEDISDVVELDRIPKAMHGNLQLDGKVVAAPLNQTVNGLIYNKTLFDQAGIKVPMLGDNPWTWEQWEEATQKVVEKTDARYGMAMDYSEHRLKGMMYQYGGQVFDKNGDPKLNTPQNIAAINKFLELHKKKVMPDDVWLGGEDASNLFKTGTIATLFSGSWRVLDFSQTIDKFDWQFALMPKEVSRGTLTGGNKIVAFKNSGLEAEAKEFISWLTKKESQDKYMTIGNYIPVYKDVTPDYKFGAQAFEVLRDEAANVTENFVNDDKQYIKYKDVSHILRREVVMAMQGEKSVEQALVDTEEKFKELKL